MPSTFGAINHSLPQSHMQFSSEASWGKGLSLLVSPETLAKQGARQLHESELNWMEWAFAGQ